MLSDTILNLKKRLPAALLGVILLAAFSGCTERIAIMPGIIAGSGNGGHGGHNSFTPDPGHITDSLTGGKPRLGVNYNGQFDFIDSADLARTKTTWVRGFVDFFKLYQDRGQLAGDPGISQYLRLKARGYKTILNIKWDFSKRSFPDTASPEMKQYSAFLITLLNRIWKGTDLIVIGNEPFIESKVSDRGDSLVQFYEKVAHDVENFEAARGRHEQVPIFIGAFNNLYLASWRTNSVEKLLAFAKSDPWIAGVDLHVHHNGIKQLKVAMDAVNDQIREDQKILVTEFSLVKYFQAQLGLSIPQSFADAYGYAGDMKNYQYIDRALKTPVSSKEWDDFLSSSSWFETRKKYLVNAFEVFSGYPKFAVATYAMRQSYPPARDFTMTTMPWILNALYANRTVKADAAGKTAFNYAWIDDFLAIQDR